MAQRGPSAGPADLRRPKSAKGVVIDGCVVTESKPSGLVKEACFGALCRIDVAAFRGPVSCRTKPQCKDVLGVVGPLHAGTFVDGFSRLHASVGAQSCACFRRGWRRSPAALWYMNYLRALPFSQLWASLQFRLSDVAAGRRHCSISIRVGHTPVFVTRSWNCISAGQVAHFFRWHELLTISEGLSVHLTRV